MRIIDFGGILKHPALAFMFFLNPQSINFVQNKQTIQ